MEKIINNIQPSDKINFYNSSYHLKSIIQHHGTELGKGHYTSILNLDKQWIECNDEYINTNNITPTDSDGYVYIYEQDDPSQEPCSSLEETRDTLNVNTNKKNESNGTHAEKNIPELTQHNESRQAKASSKTKGKNNKNIIQENVNEIIRTSPIKRKQINYKECPSRNQSKNVKKCTRSSPIKRKPVNYKEIYSGSPLKKQKKSRQCYIPTYPIDLSDNTDNQYNRPWATHGLRTKKHEMS